jgi:hypothetical protein
VKYVSCLIALALSAASVRADGWHAGLNLRVDPGTHPVRAGGGIERGRLDTMLVLDPMFWTDGQHDVDALAYWQLVPAGWSVLTGWRTTAIGILGGRQYQQKLLLGIGAPLPFFGELPLRARWSFELAALVVKHGADLPREWISFDSGRDFIDLLNFGMFVTFEYARD